MYQVVKRGDTERVYWRVTQTLWDSHGNPYQAPIDLTGATVVAHVRVRKPVGPMIPLVGGPETPETDGRLWHPASSLEPGTYDLEIELTVDGVTTTVPKLGFATLVVDADMG